MRDGDHHQERGLSEGGREEDRGNMHGVNQKTKTIESRYDVMPDGSDPGEGGWQTLCPNQTCHQSNKTKGGGQIYTGRCSAVNFQTRGKVSRSSTRIKKKNLKI